MKFKNIAVFDTLEDRIIQQSFELVSFIDTAEDGISDTIFIVTGRNVRVECERASSEYGINIMSIEEDSFFYPNPNMLLKILGGIIREYEPETVCFTHTMRNCAVAAGLSAELKISSITGVESYTSVDGEPVYIRTVFNGKVKESVRPLTHQKIITIVPGAYTDFQRTESPDFIYPILHKKVEYNKTPYMPLSIKRELDAGAKLEDADVIIAAGRGIGKPENLEMIRETAKLFDNSAIGASRPVCDNKWLPYRHQVGVTGKTVSPKLYMALGISGSQQHITGMKNSRCIVAVNRDPHAAIFSVADYIIVEDLENFLPAFIRQVRERLGEASG